MSTIPGYRLHDPALAPPKLTLPELDELRASLLLGPEDIAALRRAGAVLGPQVEAILDVWYGFVGATPHLLAAFSDPTTGTPDTAYLAAVRLRFGQWIRDTCAAEFDTAWLAWQEEIGRRHHRIGKNLTDGARGSAIVPMRHLLALVAPITLTVRPFLAAQGANPAEVETMQSAWFKAVLLQAILWARPYTSAGDF